MAMAQEQDQQQSGGGRSTMDLLKKMPGPIGQLANFKENFKGMTKEALKEGGKKVAKMAAQKAKQMAIKAGEKLLTNPYVLAAIGIVVGIIVLFILLITIINNLTGANGPNAQPGPPPTVYTFVALGDSLTAWPNNSLNYTPNGTSNPQTTNNNTGTPWPSQLRDEDQSLTLLKNAGIPGQTTTQMLSRFNSDVAAYSPDVLFILGGTNDTGKGIDTIGNIKQIITKAQSAGIKKIILLTIPHQCPNGSFTALNNQIKSLASNFSNTSVIDISNALSCGANYQSDGLHFTDVGAKVLANYIDAQIKAQNILPQATQVTQATNAFHFYCQYASVYNSDKSVCNLTHWGCGVTSTAMILTSFGDTVTPKDLGIKYGFGCETATSPKNVTNTLNSFGYIHQKIPIPSSGTININTVRSLTTNGFYVITGACITCRGCHGPTWHTTVVTAVNSDGTFVDADPTYCSSDSSYSMRTLDPTYPGPDVKDGPLCSGGWNWAYAAKKQ